VANHKLNVKARAKAAARLRAQKAKTASGCGRRKSACEHARRRISHARGLPGKEKSFAEEAKEAARAKAAREKDKARKALKAHG